MSADEMDRLERERRDADRRYNDALTALDRAIVETNGRPLNREDFDRLATAAILFLQQITAFVDSKDRSAAAEAKARVERVERALSNIAELGVRVNVLQRAVDASIRTTRPQSPPSVTALPAALSPDDEYKYVGFEDQFRGSDESVHSRVRAYVPLFAGATDVVDLGCGRGELLAALKEAGIRACGVDVNSEMVASARARGLDAVQGDALAYLTSVADQSRGGVIATQVVEHLEPSYLLRLLGVAAQKLRPGAPIVLETINAACWLAFFSSYIRDITHVRPLHPETLQYLLRASGFERVTIQYSAPVPESMKMKAVELPPDLVTSQDPSSIALARMAHTINANAIILNNLMFTHLDYAVIGYRT
jgi:O-antigen chain-terminating methyltransferase